MIRDFRKPLIVIAPKGMLRHPSCVSTLNDVSPGKTFAPVLGDPEIDPKMVSKVVFLSGKHFYTVQKERESRKVKDMAIVRLEVREFLDTIVSIIVIDLFFATESHLEVSIGNKPYYCMKSDL
jgi:2-oxoglutarate dehydrogenase complex dehydrogenase (E1) component-like enzyme